MSENIMDNNNDEDLSNTTTTWIPLLPMEDGLVAYGLAPICTLTKMQGNGPPPMDLIKERIRSILIANPWLIGQLEKNTVVTASSSKAKQTQQWGIRYQPNLRDSNNEEALDKLISDKEGLVELNAPNDIDIDIDIDSETNTPLSKLSEICQKHSKALLQPKKDLMQSTFWRVTIIRFDDQRENSNDNDTNAANTSWLLLVSLSHVVGDGHTFYDLYNYLVGGGGGANNKTNCVVPKLIVDRQLEFANDASKHLGDVESKIMTSIGLIGCAIRGLLGKLLLSKWYPDTWSVISKVFIINETTITKIKQDYIKKKDGNNSDVPTPSYISTNDIITSSLLKHTPFGLMAINLRNRWTNGPNNTMGGNYETCLAYRNADVIEPSFIRQSISKMKRAITFNEVWSHWPVAFNRLSVVTNWSSFHHSGNVNLNGKGKGSDGNSMKAILHYPIQDIASQVPPTLTASVVFRPLPNKLAVLVAGTPSILRQIESDPIWSNDKNETIE